MKKLLLILSLLLIVSCSYEDPQQRQMRKEAIQLIKYSQDGLTEEYLKYFETTVGKYDNREDFLKFIHVFRAEVAKMENKGIYVGESAGIHYAIFN